MTLLLMYLFLAIVISFFCSLMEAVLLSTPLSYLKTLESKGHKSATIFVKYKKNIDLPLSAILSLNTIANTMGAAGVGAQATAVFGEAYFGYISAALTVLILVFSEILPKTIGAQYWRGLALFVGKMIRLTVIITYPLVVMSKMVTRLINRKGSEHTVSREEISALAHIGMHEGVFGDKENNIIQNILRFAERRATSLMTPRQDVVWLDAELSPEEFKSMIMAHPHTVFPVCQGRMEEILGVLYIKDYFENCSYADFKLENIIRKPVYIPETLSYTRILELFRKHKNYYGIVINEYGSMEGIITLHDMTENIFGALPQEAVTDDPQIVKRKDGSYLIDGAILIDELDELLDIEELVEGKPEFATLAGFILNHLNRIPLTGDVFEVSNYRFEIVDMDKSKIDKVLLVINSASED